MEYENKEICSICKGKCCKKSGCDYFVSDFDIINKNELIKALETGSISIASAFHFKRVGNKDIVIPILYLRARNTNRGIIDLYSLKTQCSMLKESGCSYDLENRPGGGVNLIPHKNNACIPLKNPIEEIKKWLPYQNLLSKLVKRYTGKSVEVVIREDVEELFFDILTQNFEGVSEAEIHDITSGISKLIKIYPDCYENAKRRKENIQSLILRREK